MRNEEICYECGDAMTSVARPGRTRRYRGREHVVPADTAILTCVSCGATCMDGKEVDELGAGFERQRASSQFYVVTVSIALIVMLSLVAYAAGGLIR